MISGTPQLRAGPSSLNLCRQALILLPRDDHVSKHTPASDRTLQEILRAFNAHDLDAIMEFFADDCSFDMPRGPHPWGERFIGKAAVREALATRFKGLPDVHYGEDRHWVSGNLGVSEWLLTGTTPDGRSVRVQGCDHWEFRDEKVIRKDSYWKIVEKEG
jgi:ketosteroid isomerase-like protein